MKVEPRYSHVETLLQPPTDIPRKPLPKKMFDSHRCPKCGAEGPFKYRALFEDKRTGEVTWGCAVCGYEEKVSAMPSEELKCPMCGEGQEIESAKGVSPGETEYLCGNCNYMWGRTTSRGVTEP